jgi:hypothetical protein
MSITEDPVGEDIFLAFSVRDTGCGLTMAEMGHLFHRFSQASPKTYKQVGPHPNPYSWISLTHSMYSMEGPV